jgi:hypothetical protein
MEYAPPAGDFPADYKHLKCPEPEPKKGLARGVNLAQARDPEDVYALLRCGGKCRADYTVPRDDPASRREPFVCPLCVEKAAEKRSHLKVVA